MGDPQKECHRESPARGGRSPGVWSEAWRTGRPGRPWGSAMLPVRRGIAKKNKRLKPDTLPDVFVYTEWNFIGLLREFKSQ